MLNNLFCSFVISHTPKSGEDAKFYTYEEIYAQAFKPYILHRDAGLSDQDIIIDEFTQCAEVLYNDHDIAPQAYAVCGNQKGIRIMNLC